MTCREIEEREILEGYVMDRLSDSERDAFEQHYFECDSCFAQLQTGLAIQAELRRPFVRKQARGAFFGHIKIWMPAFAALVLLSVIGVWRYTRQLGPQQTASSTTQPLASSPSLEQLARVEAPPYSEVVLRGAEDQSQAIFRKAMKHYLNQDYAGAIPGLRTAVNGSPRTAQFNFYLGVCYLLTIQTDSAIASFRKAIALNDPVYSQSAHFYLAKAYLQSKDVPRAEEELRTTVEVGGSKAAEAGEILRQLGK